MPTLEVHNLEGKETEKVNLKDKFFAVKFNPALVHQIAVSLQNNQRISKAHTKTKGEVRGGGKKPWKQKGTGRARAGSNRSPLWVGGGITFGPRNNRDYSRKINKRVGVLVFSMVLGKKISDKEVKMVENWDIEKPKTKKLVDALGRIGVLNQSVLLVAADKNENLKRAGRNLPNVSIKSAAEINTLDLLTHKLAVVEKRALAILEDRLSGKKTKPQQNPKPKLQRHHD